MNAHKNGVKKGCKHVNKNSNLSHVYITPQNPYNKQVFVEANLHFSTVINL
ncbi:hypothetical protein ECDEC15B_0587 [Escherichia coli DEC15B]|nr:hypothetical protein ECDEC15B_0587 [Escherichia coli DEC15B]EHY20795.1 hypothetical protein ECDEC15E_0819 [Escherichia coli DEC15E]